MALVINTNIASLTAQRNLTESQSISSTAMERLSSGLRINSAKDDAAGLAIGNRFSAQAQGMAIATRNASDGISLAQTAEGALQETTDNLLRMRELAVQSANDTLSAADRTALNTELTQLAAEIDRVATSTTFNGLNLLDGSRAAATFQVGAAANQTVQMAAIASVRTTALGTFTGASNNSVTAGSTATANQNLTITDTSGNVTGTITGIENSARATVAALNASGLGFVATANATNVAAGTQAINATVAGASTIDINGVTISITNTTVAGTTRANTVTAINAQSAVTGVVATDTGGGVSLSAAAGENITVGTFAAGTATGATITDYGLAPATTTFGTFSYTFENAQATGTLGVTSSGNGITISDAIGVNGTSVAAIDVLTQNTATTAITAIDRALANVDATRGTLGATQARFESVVSSTMVARESAEASRSRIMDADFAVETANMTKGQILQQAGISVLAQANAMPQQVLSLLQ